MSITCGELLVHLLEDYGVDTVFGIPGVHNVELYRGLPATKIRHVTPRHEQGAGFMADGYARTSGKPGVCFIITGPGMTNIATALNQANADSVPLLVISSVNNSFTIGDDEGHLHAMHDQRATIDTLCAFSKTIWRPRDLPKVLAEAFNVFSSARPRPVHIQIPVDVITAPADDVPATVGALAARPVANPTQLDEAARLLKAAKRPVICYGGGVRQLGQETATRLAERLDAPVLLTSNAKGLLPPGHPLSLGSRQSFKPVRALIRRADVVLAIGTEMGETDYDTVFDEGFPQPKCLIRIDIDPLQLNKPYLAKLAIAGDAAHAVRGLLERLPQTAAHDGAKIAAEVRQQLLADQPAVMADQCGFLKLIRDTLPGVVFMGDSTQPVYWGTIGFEASQPASWFNSATGFGTLGYGLPAAIGARLALDKPVVCLAGDGGFQFTLPELMPAVEQKLPVIVVIWHNDGYHEIRNYMKSRGLPTIGVDVTAPDFKLLAQAYGAAYARVTSATGLADTLRTAAAAQGPTLVEVGETDAFIAELGKSYRFYS
ncbi:MAG TPA: 5-guanidino-2-oxopentanoate decarboxylase [Nevskiaceae bacterium]|nr:5-guanidino-2-oxopentanoate decarboxylase [Nevskiaceae bacterium]